MNIDTIIHKFLLKKESKEELELLEQWKSESQANIQALEELQEHWKQFETLKDYHNYNASTAWSSVSSKIDKAKPKLFNLKYISSAAAVLLTIAAALYFMKPVAAVNDTKLFSSTTEVLQESFVDNSKVWLNKSTIIDYSNFKSEHRVIEFVSGEAFFDIQSNPDSPFQIDMGKYQIQVIGTAFNLKRLNEFIDIELTEGQIIFSNQNRQVKLNAGDRLFVENGSMAKTTNKSKNIAAWKTKILIFENTLLEDALKDLSDYYGTEIKISASVKHLPCILNTKFTDETLEEMLQELNTVYGIEYKIQPDSVIITETDC